MSNTKSNDRPSFTYTIGGVKIQMPVKPYPSQVSMMDKVAIILTMSKQKILLSIKFPFRLFVGVKNSKTVFWKVRLGLEKHWHYCVQH